MQIRYKRTKRLFDIVISLTSLIVLSPVFISISIVNIIINGKPVFFKQERPGEKAKIFRMYKFRTMTDKTGPDGQLLSDKLRITKFGAFLRKTSLDELPELINVLIGNMSIVGPRPLLVSYLPYYTHREMNRHNVKPGITGLAQISGRNYLNWDERLKLDVQYSENMSFKNDILILLKTILVVFTSKGVSVDSSVVEPSFIDYRKSKNNSSKKTI